MTLMDFDTILDTAGTQRVVVVTTPPVVVLHEEVAVIPTPVAAATHILKEESAWGWEEVRDYVATEIIKRHGAFPRNSFKEAGIFKSFVQRYGADASRIARFAFEHNNGMWANAPISVNRFTKASDPYFGDKILARI